LSQLWCRIGDNTCFSLKVKLNQTFWGLLMHILKILKIRISNSSSFNKGSIYNLFLFLIKPFKKTRIFFVFSNFKYCNRQFSIWTIFFFHVACRNLDHNYFNGTLNMLAWDQDYLLHGVLISMVNNNISGLEPSWDDESLIYSPVL